VSCWKFWLPFPIYFIVLSKCHAEYFILKILNVRRYIQTAWTYHKLVLWQITILTQKTNFLLLENPIVKIQESLKMFFKRSSVIGFCLEWILSFIVHLKESLWELCPIHTRPSVLLLRTRRETISQWFSKGRPRGFDKDCASAGTHRSLLYEVHVCNLLRGNSEILTVVDCFLTHAPIGLHADLVISISQIYSDNKSKAVPLHATKALGGRGYIAPTHCRPRH
jgi:hypothetical protein